MGKHTKKVCSSDQNRCCAICTVLKVSPKVHDCYCNWDSSLQTIESDIITEGLKLSERKCVAFATQMLLLMGTAKILINLKIIVSYECHFEKTANHLLTKSRRILSL